MRVSLTEVNSYLPKDKWQLESLDNELVRNSEEQVLSSIASIYDTSVWTDESSTPRLIRSLIAMTVAGIAYNRQFADEAAEAGSYGNWLLKRVDMVLRSIQEGTTVVVDEDPLVDRTTGEIRGYSDPVFTIGETF